MERRVDFYDKETYIEIKELIGNQAKEIILVRRDQIISVKYLMKKGIIHLILKRF